MLTGARGYKAIAQWTRAQSSTVWQWLGFQRRPPCANSFRNLLLALPPETLEGVLRKWMETALGQPLPEESRGTSLDGKTLCNTLAAHERNVHLLSLLDQALGGVLSQQAVDPSARTRPKPRSICSKRWCSRGAWSVVTRCSASARFARRLSMAAVITCSLSKTTSQN